jgi:outer membrane protein assembly factor BamB
MTGAKICGWFGFCALLGLSVLAARAVIAQTVATYHGDAARSGNFVMPTLTWDKARALRLDAGFAPNFRGHLYAQPLYWHPPGRPAGVLIVASESNTVSAIDAINGNTLWSRDLGAPEPLSAFPCGNIGPLGITGTPVIDQASATLYLEAMIRERTGPHHRLFALALADGATRPGWPVDVAAVLRGIGQDFDPHVQNQRAALILLNGNVYVGYGGFYGDCGDYHGWVVGVSETNPQHVVAWRTRARGGAVWAPGGIASADGALFVSTGNTMDARDWSDGEAVLRLAPDLHHSDGTRDFFAPGDWRALDDRDADLGGSNPLLFDLPRAPDGQPVVLALGKDARAYLLDRRNLGGIGGALVAERVATYPIRTSPVFFASGDAAFVAFEGRGARCPTGQHGDLTELRIAAGKPPVMDTAWCGAMSGAGSPIVTTTDGRANPVVWILGAEGDDKLHGFRGDTGEALYTSPPLAGLRHFQTLIAADNRLYVGADGRLYAFDIPR